MKTKEQLTDQSIGKRFIRRDYTIVKITERNCDHFADDLGRWYYSNGTILTEGESPYDLITEVEELPDFNPMKIDEERFMKIFKSVIGIKSIIDEYNSTLPSPLVPLPKEMPKEFDGIIRAWALNEIKQVQGIWEWVLEHYGTPSKEPLPSVEELAEVIRKFEATTDLTVPEFYSGLAQHLHSKYSLHPKQEWWKGDIKGMKVQIKTGEVKELDGNLYARTGVGTFVNITALTPYTPPTADQIIDKYGLSDEEVKILKNDNN